MSAGTLKGPEQAPGSRCKPRSTSTLCVVLKGTESLPKTSQPMRCVNANGRNTPRLVILNKPVFLFFFPTQDKLEVLHLSLELTVEAHDKLEMSNINSKN